MSARDVQTYNLRDFTGGLNLDPDEFRMSDNESPELLNVDVSYRGGVSHRKGYSTFQTFPTNGVRRLMPWYGHPNGPCVFVVDDIGDVHEVTDTSVYSYTYFPQVANEPYPIVSAEFNGSLFVASAHQVDEATGDGAGGVNEFLPMEATHFNDDLDNPTDDYFPQCNLVASWQGSMWAADIVEDISGPNPVAHPYRLRWSHPNQPKDWVSFHYIDFENDGGGDITALVPDGDRLLVFRERKIHAVVGAPPEGLQAFELTGAVGCASPYKVAASPNGVYFWNEERGVYKVGPQSLDWEFDRLYPALVSGRIDGTDAVVSWGGDRLYVKVEYSDIDGGEQDRSWFVLDPSVGKHGCWVRHAFLGGAGSAKFADMKDSLWFAPASDTANFLTAMGTDIVFRDSSTHVDTLPAAGATHTNRAVMRTAWVDLGEPGQLKRWRRADIVGSGLDDDQTLQLEAFTDYDSLRRRRQGEIRLHANQGGGLYGTAVFGTDTYGEPDLPIPVVDRTAPMGRARAVQLKFEDAVDPVSLPWTIDSIVVKYTPYRVRG